MRLYMKLIKKSLSTTQIIALGFFVAISIGTALLMLPVSSADGRVTPLIDALFTATTSICVTGLVVVPTYLHWSAFGKVVILLLIQLGDRPTHYLTWPYSFRRCLKSEYLKRSGCFFTQDLLRYIYHRRNRCTRIYVSFHSKIWSPSWYLVFHFPLSISFL